MDNIQLSLLLSLYRDRLYDAINCVRDSLPDELGNISKNIFNQEVITYPLLQPLYDLLEKIDKDIKELKKES